MWGQEGGGRGNECNECKVQVSERGKGEPQAHLRERRGGLPSSALGGEGQPADRDEGDSDNPADSESSDDA